MDQFDAFWAAYPRKIAKGAARRAFAKALKMAPFEDIMAGLERYTALRVGQAPQFTCHASTWLNQERWTDEHDMATAMSRRKEPTATEKEAYERWRLKMIEKYEREGRHVPMWLRPPGYIPKWERDWIKEIEARNGAHVPMKLRD